MWQSSVRFGHVGRTGVNPHFELQTAMALIYTQVLNLKLALCNCIYCTLPLYHLSVYPKHVHGLWGYFIADFCSPRSLLLNIGFRAICENDFVHLISPSALSAGQQRLLPPLTPHSPIPYSYSQPQPLPPPPVLTSTLLPPTTHSLWRICHLSARWVLHFSAHGSSHTWGQRHWGFIHLWLRATELRPGSPLVCLVFIGLSPPRITTKYWWVDLHPFNVLCSIKQTRAWTLRMATRKIGWGNKNVQRIPQSWFCGIYS